MIPIYKPYLKNYKNSALNAIESEWISNHGIYVNLSTEKIKSILGIKYCILMNNGTSATHCLFKALKFKYQHIKKIYVPNNVFIAPWNCCLMEYEPQMIEVMKISHETLNLDVSEEYILSLDRDSAVCIVHNFGNIINVPRLQRLRPDLTFVEDNCEGLFGKYEDKYSGTASLCSSVSFYGNKTITTGEGGAFFTNDESLYNYIYNIHSHGMSNKRYVHINLGTNYRMTNLQSAFLYDQLNDINNILELKSNIIKNYDNLLNDLYQKNIIHRVKFENNTIHSNWMYYFLISSSYSYSKIEKYMSKNNIEVRPLFYDIHVHDHLKQISNPNSNDFSRYLPEHGIILPSYPELKYNEQVYICKVFISYFNNLEIEFIKIDNDNKEIIELFFKENDSRHFRYYKNRELNIAIKFHIYTVCLKIQDEVIGYGHIDFEDKNWIGIFIKENKQGKGYGKILLSHLIEKARELDLKELYLSVDKDNESAIHIYKLNNFYVDRETQDYYIMCLNLV